MAFFQKKPIAGTSVPLYTLGANKTVLVIGLGNPEPRYDGTRHNLGFAVVEDFALKNDFPGWVNKKDLKALVTSANMGSIRVILAKPTTFVNLSGEAAQAIQHFYKVSNTDTLVVYDELAIGFGQLRTRIGGSDGGHNGVKSLIQHLGDDFGRLRIGIGNSLTQQADSSSFVLGKFTKKEQGSLELIYKEAAAVITEYLFGGSLVHSTRSVI